MNNVAQGMYGWSDGRGKLTHAQALEVYKLAIRGDITQRHIAAMYGICQSQVSRIKSGGVRLLVAKQAHALAAAA